MSESRKCPLKSYWSSKSYEVNGERWWWYSAHLDISLLNVLERVVCKKMSWNSIDELNETYLAATDNNSVSGCVADIEVWQQDDMPPLVTENRTVINDWRSKDMDLYNLSLAKAEKEIPREGFASLPLEIKF